MRIVECPSPNHDERPQDAAIDILVLHYTGMKTAEEALARLTDPAAKVSAHYTIDRDGRVYRHVPEERRAWHAGVSWWAGERNVNARSIGIEIVNPGHEFGYVPFTDPQIAALIDLSRGIFARHPIPPSRVVAHSDVAPARKEDPGELFPWKSLSEYGIGLWPAAGFHVLTGPFEEALARFGYGVAPEVDVPMEKVVTAFQRHYRPARLDGQWDEECNRLLADLLEQSETSQPVSA
ncbi:MAG TPA: N-acetylmuramoyl-L-alanine amidase [Rhizomicrobium sp.]|nr:N-acetylmuramoyl-L-alanine amidase [Rhizomicrobium sp.]